MKNNPVKNTGNTVKIFLVFVLTLLCSCAHQPLPTLDLNSGAWQVVRGQALWQAAADRPKIAGDVLLAKDNLGNRYIEFVKSPVVIFIAQTHNNRWLLKMIDTGKVHQGRGTPPDQFIWFYLPELLFEKTPLPDENWQIIEQTADSLTMKNVAKGAHIRVILDSPLI